MSKKYRLITYTCQECGLKVKILVKENGSLIFSILDKLLSSEQVLSNLGYYVCIECKARANLRFEYIYS